MTQATAHPEPMKNPQRDGELDAPTRDGLVARLLHMRDDVSLRKHLAGMEAKDVIRDLVKDLEEIADMIARRVEQSVTHARIQASLARMDAKKAIAETSESVKKELRELEQKGSALLREIERRFNERDRSQQA